MSYFVSFSVCGDVQAAHIRALWADNFTYVQSVMAKRVTPDKRHTTISGHVTDLPLLISHVELLGESLDSFSFGPSSKNG